MTETRLNTQERKALGTLGGVYALRMWGLFIILPVFAIYAETLSHSTPLLAGIAVGVYGLTQALLQIPMGWLSDRYGRRGVVWIGLLIFLCGSLIAATAQDIYLMILGRAVQGAGAVSAALAAWVADLSRESTRARIMGLIGMMIGLSFILALIVSPILAKQIGVSGIFYLVAALAAIAIVMVYRLAPVAERSSHRAAGSWKEVTAVLQDRVLLRLSLGAASIHLLLVANFMSLPLAMRDLADYPIERHGMFYFIVLVLSALFLFPALRMAQPRVVHWMRLCALMLAAVEISLIFVRHDVMLIGVSLVLFFIAFNLLEAQLPTQVSRLCPAHLKGTSLGVFTTVQFLGAFLGGIVTGIFLQYYTASALYIALTVCMLIWYYLLAELIPLEKKHARTP